MRIEDGTGSSRKAGVDKNHRILVSPDMKSEFSLAVARGLVPGMSEMLKFGRNESVGTTFEPIWEGSGTAYVFYPTTAVPVRIFGGVDAVNDRGLPIEVLGLDGFGNEISEIVNLDGANSTTQITLALSYWRIYRMFNRGTTDNVQIITVEATTTANGVTIGDDAALMAVGANQTNMALYTIPAGKTGYMQNYYASTDRTTGSPKSIDMELRIRRNSSVSTGEVFQIKNHQGLVLTGNSHFRHVFATPLKIDALSDIRITGEADIGTADIHAGFDMILVDN